MNKLFKLSLMVFWVCGAGVLFSQNIDHRHAHPHSDLYPHDSNPIAIKIAQQQKEYDGIKSLPLLLPAPDAAMRRNSLKEVVGEASFFVTNEAATEQVLRGRPEILKMELPIDGQMKTLLLYRANVFSPDFQVYAASDRRTPHPFAAGAYYWGTVEGAAESLVAIAVNEGEISGMLAIDNETYNLGKLEGKAEKTHILYQDKDLQGLSPFECGVGEEHIVAKMEESVLRAPNPNNCVKMYIEVGHTVYLDKFSSIDYTVAYVTNIFFQSALLYAAESINLSINEIVVWDTPDPYGNSLNAFTNAVGINFNGDLAHLVDYGGGGLAWINALCSNLRRTGYSGIYNFFSTVPTYSWSVEVITHEIGHNLGSRHTHDCVWNNNNTAIDRCGPSINIDPDCDPSAPIPTNGGTIMSYCHLISAGINFNNGFGPQPGDLIRNNVYNSPCLSPCSPTLTNDDAGVLLISPAPDSVCADSIVFVASVYNLGTNVLTSANVSHQLDNGPWVTNSFSGPGIPPLQGGGVSQAIYFGPGNHTVRFRTDLPNGNPDSNPANDEKSVTFYSRPQPCNCDGSLTTTATSTDVSCNGGTAGTANVNVSGGTPPYTYLWSNGSTTSTAIGLSANIYTVVITDDNGCTATASATVSEPSALSATSSSSDVSCNGGNDGTASVNVSGGTSPYTYAWSNGGTTANISGLSANTYTVVVTDDNGCSISASATVGEPSALSATAASTDVSCNGGNDGTASVNVSGGTAPYIYQWSNGGTTASISGLVAGVYSVVVTDDNGCSASSPVTVNEPAMLSAATTSTGTGCGGGSTGTATVTVSGGTAPYAYLWSNGATTAAISGLSANTYTVVVTDDNGCSTSASATVSGGGNAGLAVSASATGLSCVFGTATASVSGGVSPYNYAWSNGGTTATITGLNLGIYTVTVTDDNGCTGTASATVVSLPSFLTSASTTDASCNGGNDGTATVNPSGGTPPYSYLWSNGATTQTATGLTAGTYTVVITDDAGCILNSSMTVGEPTPLVLSPGAFDVRCNGLNDGSVYVNVSGGTPYMYGFYDYSWSTGSTDGAIWNSLSPNTYSVTVTDMNGCTASASATVSEPTPVTVTVSSTNPTAGNADGAATATAAGGVPAYLYLWSSGDVGPTASNLAAGQYTVTVVDMSDCPTTATVTLEEPVCTYQPIDFEDFENGWGIWNDGGSDCRKHINDQAYANSGVYCVRLRDNTNSSVMTTDLLNLSNFTELKVGFSYYVVAFNNQNEDFWLQISTDGGATYTTVEEWNLTDEFQNNERKGDAVTINGPFTANTRLRFRCDASGNGDKLYIDDVEIKGCALPNQLFAAPITGSNVNAPAIGVTPDMVVLEEAQEELVLYPNPVNDRLKVKYHSLADGQAQVLVMDILGQVVSTERVSGNAADEQQLTLDVGHLEPGQYFVLVVEKGKRCSARFVKM